MRKTYSGMSYDDIRNDILSSDIIKRAIEKNLTAKPENVKFSFINKKKNVAKNAEKPFRLIFPQAAIIAEMHGKTFKYTYAVDISRIKLMHDEQYPIVRSVISEPIDGLFTYQKFVDYMLKGVTLGSLKSSRVMTYDDMITVRKPGIIYDMERVNNVKLINWNKKLVEFLDMEEVNKQIKALVHDLIIIRAYYGNINSKFFSFEEKVQSLVNSLENKIEIRKPEIYRVLGIDELLEA